MTTTSSASTRSGSDRWWIPLLITLIVAEMVSAFENTMAIQMLYAPKELFGGVPLTSLSWIVTAFMLTGATSVAFAGRLGDQFGRRRMLLTVLAISIVGSVISAVAPSLGVVILGRAVQGVSSAILPLAIGIVRESFPSHRHGLGIAFVSTTALTAGASGLLVGGIILDYTDWRYIFWFGAALAIAGLICAWVFVPYSSEESTDTDKRIDYLGGLLFAGGIAAVLYGITIAESAGWAAPRVLAFVCGGVVVLALWVWWELYITFPMIQLNRFRNRKFALGMLATALLGIGPIGMSTILIVAVTRTADVIPLQSGSSLDLPVGIGLSATKAGLIGLIGATIGFAASPIIGRIATRWGARATIFIGCVIAGSGFVVIWLNPSSLLVVILGLVLNSLGTGFTYSGMPTIITEAVTTEDVSAATGLNVVVRTTFQGAAATVLAVLLSINEIRVGGSSFMSQVGFNWAIGAIVGTALLTMLVVVFVPNRRVADAEAGAARPQEATAGKGTPRGNEEWSQNS